VNKTTKRDRKERKNKKKETEKKERIKQKRLKEKKSASIEMHFFPLYLNGLEVIFCNLKSKKDNFKKKDLKNKYTRGRLM
jgi:hypothetical protein